MTLETSLLVLCIVVLGVFAFSAKSSRVRLPFILEQLVERVSTSMASRKQSRSASNTEDVTNGERPISICVQNGERRVCILVSPSGGVNSVLASIVPFESGQEAFVMTPEIMEDCTRFLEQRSQEIPDVVKCLQKLSFDKQEVAKVGDICWWPYSGTGPNVYLAAATLANNKHVVICCEGSDQYSLLSGEGSTAQVVLENLSVIPRIEFDSTRYVIMVRFSLKRALAVRYNEGCWSVLEVKLTPKPPRNESAFYKDSRPRSV